MKWDMKTGVIEEYNNGDSGHKKYYIKEEEAKKINDLLDKYNDKIELITQ